MNEAACYDALLDAGRQPSGPCPICTGDEEADPCGEECDAIYQLALVERRIEGLRQAAQVALNLGLEYALEGADLTDERLSGCLQQVDAYLEQIRDLRHRVAA